MMTTPSCNPTQSDPLPSDPPSSAPPQNAPTRSGSQSDRHGGLRVRRFALHFGLVLLAASALGVAVDGRRAGLSVALGVTLAGVNLLLMQKITSALGESGAGAAWGLVLPFKLAAVVGVAYALVAAGVAQPVPLAMGFALLPLTGVFLPRPSSVPDLVTPHPPRRRESTY